MSEHQRPELIKKDELPLSGEALIELITAVHEKGASFKFRAKGFSMSPFVKCGDIITISPTKKSAVGRGDIVAFVHPESGKPIVHRVIRKESAAFRIRGDSLHIDDGLIPESAILGKVAKIERDGQKVYLGLGVERYIIAFFSERSQLRSLISGLSGLRRLVRSGFKKILP
jgi:signal peptidase I